MRRVLTVIFVVWACSCGIRGPVPVWVQLWAAGNAQAAQASPAGVCTRWRLAYNREAALHASPLRIVRTAAHTVDSEGLVIVCVLTVRDLATADQGCYRMVIDTSFRIWQNPVRVRCDHPWEKPRPIRPIA